MSKANTTKAFLGADKKCPVDQNCQLLLECDRKNVIAEFQAEVKREVEFRKEYIRRSEGFVRQLQAQLEQENANNTLLRGMVSEWEENEGAICPEDVGFGEYIKYLKAQLERALRELKASTNRMKTSLRDLSTPYRKSVEIQIGFNETLLAEIKAPLPKDKT